MQKIKQFFSNPIFWCFGVIGGLMATFTKIFFSGIPQNTVDSPLSLFPHEAGNFYNYCRTIFSVENTVLLILSTVFFYSVINFLYRALGKIKLITNTKNRLRARTIFFITLAASFVIFLIAFLVYYPGLGMNDTHTALQEFVRDNQHPPIFQAIVYGIFHVFQNITGSGNTGYAMITFVQLFSAACIISYFIAWLYSHKTANWIVAIIAIFLIGSPLVSNYTVTVLKDTWFAYAFLLLLPNLYDFIVFKTPSVANKILLLTGLLGIWISRSNGQMILFVLLVVMLIVLFKNKSKRLFIAISAGAFLIAGLCVNLITSSRTTEDVSFRESVSVPLAQIGAVVNANGELSQEDKDFIEKILPLDKWSINYRLSFIDFTKMDEQFDNAFLREHKTEFFQTWLSIAVKNPGIYTRAYLFQTYGLWNLAYWDTDSIIINQSVFQDVLNNISKEDPADGWNDWIKTSGLSNQPALSPELSGILNNYYQSTALVNLFFSAGVIILICFGCTAIIIVTKKYRYLILYLPVYLTWGSMMIATPASMIYRYNFYLLLSLPFIIFVAIKATQKTKKIKKNALSTLK